MRILHYILGFPPMRSGGLTRYSIDLMTAQIQLGHEVFAAYPGNPSLFKRKCVVKEKAYNGIQGYKISNAVLVPLLHGTKNPEYFIADDNTGYSVFKDFFDRNNFNILHIHTMMGVPKAFLLAAKECGVKTVFTSHDYFGLCPKVNFVDDKELVCEFASEDHCTNCNANSKAAWYLWLRNTKLLLIAKKLLKR